MGGLVGIISPNPRLVSPDRLAAMLSPLGHRSPAGVRTIANGSMALGHLRLNRQSGDFPFTAGDLTITFSGRILNLAELARDLAEAGNPGPAPTEAVRGLSSSFPAETFKTPLNSDGALPLRGADSAAILLRAYEHWGDSFPVRLNGAFALAIWDASRRTIFLARDRYGQKPLYYAFQNEGLFFASEQKAILNHPDFNHPGLDPAGLLEYFTFQNFFSQRTLLNELRLFPAGCLARFSLGQSQADFMPQRYWDYNFQEPQQPLDAREYQEEMERLLGRAVERHLAIDDEVGSYLSGGMDSGAITLMAAARRPWLKTFTCGFDLHSVGGLEMGFDEREKAEYMSYLLKTEHYQMVLKAGDMERIMPRLIYHMEEPRVGQSYPNFYVAQLVSKFVKVVLSGAGGDELFGGYPWRYYRAATADGFKDFLDKYYVFWQRLIPDHLVGKIFQPIWPEVKNLHAWDMFEEVFSDHRPAPGTPVDYINLSLRFEAKTFLHGLLVVDEKLSMAHGLEILNPFLDNDLVDFAMRIPMSLKLKNIHKVPRLDENRPGSKTEQYFALARDGKIILREFMSRHLPPEIAAGGKQGFSAPDASWFRGESLDYVKKLLYDHKALLYNFLDRKTVCTLMDEHLSGQENRRLFIWSLLCFEHWLKIFG